MSIPLEQWPDERAAAAQLQTSTKTIHRYAAAGKIEIRKRPRPGKKPENVCNPHDIEHLMPKVHVIRDEETAGPGVALRWPQSRKRSPGKEFLEMIRTIAQSIETERRNVPKAWLTLEEACELSGFGKGFVRRRVREGKIDALRAGPRGQLRIRRASLEAFAG